MTETVTVHVWQGERWDSYDDLLERDPDGYELPLAETELGRAFEVRDDERVTLADAIDHHGTYAFDVPNDQRPVTLNVHTNDSYHNPTEWGKPLERGLTFHERDDYEPFKTEIWGRIMMWAERPEGDDE
ncbi:hypothetical protein [Halomontanus rarus]|uniref:hypothetical protein n=1 Tax=Halomontanus rarus TaxID=3034020 RepID=UPI00307C4AD4